MSLLYSKKSRNIIKYTWAVFALLIILSLIIAMFAGF